MTIKKMTRLISDTLFESQEFWTADSRDKDFKLPDNVIVVNGEEEDGTYIIHVMKLDED